MNGNGFIFLSMHWFVIDVVVGILLGFAAGMFLVAAGKRIGKLHGSRRLMMGCYVMGTICLLLAIIAVLNQIGAFVRLGPNFSIVWQ